MHRRRYLALVGATVPQLSGCIETVTPRSSTNTHSNSSETGKNTTNIEHTVSDKQETLNNPGDIYIKNEDDTEHLIYISVKQVIVPECRKSTPPCGMPNKVKQYLNNTFRVEAGCGFGIIDVIKQVGEYQVDVHVKSSGSAEYTWHIDESDNNLFIGVTKSGNIGIHI